MPFVFGFSWAEDWFPGVPLRFHMSHVKNALARFNQVQDVSDADRDLAFANIKKAAQHYGVEIAEASWHDLGKTPHTPNKSH